MIERKRGRSLGAEDRLSHRQIDQLVFKAILQINQFSKLPAFEDEVSQMTKLPIEQVRAAFARLQREKSIRPEKLIGE